MINNFYRIHKIIRSIQHFQTFFGLLPLRPYQLKAAQAVIDSVLAHDGETFVWKFARQGGKDETLTAIYLYLMTLFSRRTSAIVTAAPTYKPQTELAMRRLEDRLRQNIVLKRAWGRNSGYIYNIGRSNTMFFSANSSANVVGATAYPLLVMNEAQDISPAIYDKRFAPMAAANNATRLFSGTAWTSDTLLAREERACRAKEERDGRQRVFLVDGYDIAAVHPPYRTFLEDQVSRMGVNHPIIRTQYLCQEIDAQSGMFNATRLALMHSDRPFFSPLPEQGEGPGVRVSETPEPGQIYSFLIDVAGQDEAQLDMEGLGNTGRDSTTLSIVEIDLSTLPILQAPTYRVIARRAWTGDSHLAIFGQLKNFAESWLPQYIVIDATGVGEGLWAMLDKTFPARVIPVKFSRQVKSEIGWGFITIIETGRFKDCAPNDDARIQYEKCQSEILPGPAKTLKWGVPDGTRAPDGQLVHDDYILADALVAKLDKLTWSSRSPTLYIPSVDPLLSMDSNF
jgi:hypothetical protein